MRKHLLNMVAFSLMLVLAAGTVFGAGTQEAAKETTVNMFQLKVEIKDAIDGYAAAYSAVAADGSCVMKLYRNLLSDSLLFHACPCRTDIHTMSAGYAGTFFKRQTKFGNNDRIKAPVQESESGHSGNLLAGSEAQTAEYAFLRISDYERMRIRFLFPVYLTL